MRQDVAKRKRSLIVPFGGKGLILSLARREEHCDPLLGGRKEMRSGCFPRSIVTTVEQAVVKRVKRSP